MLIRYNKKQEVVKPSLNYSISAIIVCVDFDDFLAETLPYTKNFADNIYIITADDDLVTQKLCKKEKVYCLKTPRTKPQFQRGKYINYGFDEIPKNGYFVISDADTVIPMGSRQKVENMSLNKNSLYGTQRKECDSYEQWKQYKDFGIESELYFRRASHMGFFQMFHTDFFKDKNFLRYPDDTEIYIRKDKIKGGSFVFSRQFETRIKMPFCPIVLNNVENLGQNREGRTTKRFGE